MSIPLRGPHTFAIIDGQQLAWPQSNLQEGGCKHDVTRHGDGNLSIGLPWPCERCGCLLIPVEVLRRELARYDHPTMSAHDRS